MKPTRTDINRKPRDADKTIPTQIGNIYTNTLATLDGIEPAFAQICPENIAEPIVVVKHRDVDQPNIKWLAASLPPNTANLTEVKILKGLTKKHLLFATLFHGTWLNSRGPTITDYFIALGQEPFRQLPVKALSLLTNRPESRIETYKSMAQISREVRDAVRKREDTFGYAEMKELRRFPLKAQMYVWHIIRALHDDSECRAGLIRFMAEKSGIKAKTGPGGGIEVPETLVLPSADEVEEFARSLL